MKIPLRRIDKELSLPAYKTAGAVAIDLAARTTVTVEPQSLAYVPLNIAIITPPGFMFLVAARSSLHKRGLMLANGVGIGDQDFCGDADEWQAVLFNFTHAPVVVLRGERIAQGIFVSIAKVELEERDTLGQPNRGGFGTTGRQ